MNIFPARSKVVEAANGHATSKHSTLAESPTAPERLAATSTAELDRLIATGPLSAPERELMEWFVEFTALMGVPASVGQIYGLLYLAGRPLPFENFVERLRISKGSVSQGLHFLRGLGAVRVVGVRGDRREFYEAEISPTRLVAGFLKEKVQPRLKASSERLARLEKTLRQAGAVDPLLADRVHRLHVWNQRARQFLPVVAGLVKIRT